MNDSKMVRLSDYTNNNIFLILKVHAVYGEISNTGY